MNTLDRIANLASSYVQLQARIVKRQADLAATVILLKVIATLIGVAAAALLLTALGLLLATVMPTPAALAVVGFVLAMIAGGVLFFAQSMARRP